MTIEEENQKLRELIIKALPILESIYMNSNEFTSNISFICLLCDLRELNKQLTN